MSGVDRRKYPLGASVAQLIGEGLKMRPDPSARVPCGTCRGEAIEGTPESPWAVGWLRPSSAAGCLRRLYYDITGEVAHEDTASPGDVLARSIGNAVGHRIQHALISRLGQAVQAEVRVDMPPALRLKQGHIDVLWESPAGRVVIELKTKTESSWRALSDPEQGHSLQAALYARAVNAAWVVLCYVSKGSPHPIREFQLTREFADKGVDKWITYRRNPLEDALRARVAPPRDVPANECAYCPYRACPVREG